MINWFKGLIFCGNSDMIKLHKLPFFRLDNLTF